jgi:hypothetical protein
VFSHVIVDIRHAKGPCRVSRPALIETPYYLQQSPILDSTKLLSSTLLDASGTFPSSVVVALPSHLRASRALAMTT